MSIVDYIARIAVRENEAINELVTLECLSLGMANLFAQVSSMEKPIRDYEKLNRKRVHFFGFGFFEQFGMPPHFEKILPCYFHWFGITVCNYARLVGFLDGVEKGVFPRNPEDDMRTQQLIRDYCRRYVDSIPELAPVKVWRNKVFAHFALTDPRQDDNAALLDVSVMSPTTYLENRFRVGGLVIASRGAEIEMPQWSLTEVFEALTPRYWPCNIHPNEV